tara:strand:+ start:640 stop:807 length:168 start_codon:yes stop_codon:yes gene_type:complete
MPDGPLKRLADARAAFDEEMARQTAPGFLITPDSVLILEELAAKVEQAKKEAGNE